MDMLKLTVSPYDFVGGDDAGWSISIDAYMANTTDITEKEHIII